MIKINKNKIYKIKIRINKIWICLNRKLKNMNKIFKKNTNI